METLLTVFISRIVPNFLDRFFLQGRRRNLFGLASGQASMYISTT